MTVQEMYDLHPDSWLLVTVTKENAKGKMLEGDLIYANEDRDSVYEAMEKVPDGTHVAIVFTGELIKEGEAFAF